MPHPLSRLGAAVSLAALLLVGMMAGELRAATVKFPKGEGAFTITFPESWKTAYPTRDRLTAQPKGGAKMLCTVSPLPKVTDDAGARAAVPRFTEEFVGPAGIDLKALSVSVPLNEIENEHGITLFTQEWRGKNRAGEEVVVTVGIFAAEAGDYYAIVFVGSAEADKATVADQTAIVESISLAE